MNEGYFDLLEKAYQISPGEVLYRLSGNKAYMDNDAATIKLFPTLSRLISGPHRLFEKRKAKWWAKRHTVLAVLAKKQIISEVDRFKYANERRSTG